MVLLIISVFFKTNRHDSKALQVCIFLFGAVVIFSRAMTAYRKSFKRLGRCRTGCGRASKVQQHVLLPVLRANRRGLRSRPAAGRGGEEAIQAAQGRLRGYPTRPKRHEERSSSPAATVLSRLLPRTGSWPRLKPATLRRR